jgi:NAD(P)-dependent dehydrogenase (short-subunit alcohol dehydrogenase family)
MPLRLENKNALITGAASEDGRYYTGSILHPDGGIVMQ